MKIQKFLVQIESADSTLWKIDAKTMGLVLRIKAEKMASEYTTGPEPAVTVLQEDEKEPATT